MLRLAQCGAGKQPWAPARISLPPQCSVWAQQLRDLSESHTVGCKQICPQLKKMTFSLHTAIPLNFYTLNKYVHQIIQAEILDQEDLVFLLNIILE